MLFRSYVTPSGKVASVVKIDPVRVQLAVPEKHIASVSVGNDVAFNVSAFANETFKGRITFVAPMVRPASRDIVFEAMVPNADGRLRSGMFAQATIPLPDEPTPFVAASCLRKTGDSDYVFVVREGRIEKRLVQTGPETDGVVPVLDGLR